MSKKFRFAALALSLALTASVFAGCGNSSSSGSSSPASGSAGAESSAAETSKAPAEKVEVTYMAWYNNETEPAETQKVIDKFNAENKDNITAKLISVAYNDYITKLNTMASSNTLPDSAMMSESQCIKWAVNGKLADVSDMYGTDEKPLDSLAFTYKGKPVAYSCANEVLLLYYNKDLLDKAGIPYPPASADKAWTWDEFVSAAKKLTKDKNGKDPGDAGFDPKNITTYGAQVNTLAWMWPVFAISNGGGVCTEDGSELLLGKPETIEAAQKIADLSLKEFVAPTPTTSATFPTLDVTLLSGKVAMATGGQWEIGVSLKNSLKDGLKYGVGVLPKFKTPVTLNTGGPNVIFNTGKNIDNAKKFLKWYTQEDNNISLIQSGVWMPVSQKWYKDETLMKKWADNEVHPPFDQYKTAVIDYAMNNAKQVPWYYLPGYSEIEEVLTPGMDPVWAGTKTAEDAIKNDIMPKVEKIFSANK